MDKKKIILLFAIFLLIIILMIVLTNMNKKDDLSTVKIYDPIVPEVLEIMEQEKGKLQYLDNSAQLDELRTCLQKFYIQCAYDEEFDNSEMLYNMLAPQYIDYKGITIENVRENIKRIEESKVFIYEAYLLTNNYDVYSFFVKGALMNSNNEFTDFYNIVNMDRENCTFEVILDDYALNYLVSNDFVGKDFNFDVPEYIVKNIYNTYSVTTQKTEEMIEYYFNTFRTLLVFNTNRARDFLVDNSTINKNELEAFVNDNKLDIYLLSYRTYELKVLDNETVRYRAYAKEDDYYIDVYINSTIIPKFDIGKLK